MLAGRYRLVSPLRTGGMGKVWTAEHLGLHSIVAIKLMDDELLGKPEALARFVREARAAAQIRSPHVVQILDVGLHEGAPFIAMELLSGESLAERLARVGCLSPETTAYVLGQVARGVARAHAAGLVHRDLKPSNIFLEQNGDEEVAKVLDFGIAKALVPGFETESGATRTGALLGSPHYMSPEQAEGSSTLDHRTDVWSLGVVAFECLTGTRPFDQASLGSQLLSICAWPLPVPSAKHSVPVAFDAWFARACARDPDARFASVQEAARELQSVCFGTARTPVPSLPATLAGDSSRRVPVRAAEAGASSARGRHAKTLAYRFESDATEPDPPRSEAVKSDTAMPVQAAFSLRPGSPSVARRWVVALAFVLCLGGVGGIVWWVTRDGPQVAEPRAPSVPMLPRADEPLVAPPAVTPREAAESVAETPAPAAASAPVGTEAPAPVVPPLARKPAPPARSSSPHPAKARRPVAAPREKSPAAPSPSLNFKTNPY